MKKNVLIKCIIAAGVAATSLTAMADVTLYGRLTGAVICTDDIAGTADQCSLQDTWTSPRWGIKASHKLTDSLTALGHYEFRVNMVKGRLRGASTDVAQRLAYAGIKGNFGLIAIGTQWSPFYSHVTAPHDNQQLFGHHVGVQPFYMGRLPNAVAYATPLGDIGNLTAAVVMNDDANTSGEDIDAAQIAASFAFGPINFGLGFHDSPANVPTAALDTQVIGVNVGGKFGPANLQVSYYTAEIDGGVDTDGAVLSAGFGFGSGMSILVNASKLMPDSGAEPMDYGVEFSHKLSKSYRWFAGAKQTDYDDGSPDGTEVGIGMRVDF